MSKTAIRSSIAGAVGCWPPELVGLIADYVVEFTHVWTSGQSVDVNNRYACQSFAIRRTAVAGFRMLVSARTFADGHLIWTAEFWYSILSSSLDAGFGVTRRSSNRRTEGASISAMAPDADSWIVTPFPSTNKLIRTHNYESQVVGVLPDASSRRRICFRLTIAADASTGQITAVVRYAFDGDVDFRPSIGPILITTASTVAVPQPGSPDLRDLRPCVVVSNADGHVVVQSGLSVSSGKSVL